MNYETRHTMKLETRWPLLHVTAVWGNETIFYQHFTPLVNIFHRPCETSR